MTFYRYLSFPPDSSSELSPGQSCLTASSAHTWADQQFWVSSVSNGQRWRTNTPDSSLLVWGGGEIHGDTSYTISSRFPARLSWSMTKLLRISRWQQNVKLEALLMTRSHTTAWDALRSPPSFLIMILLFWFVFVILLFLLLSAKASSSGFCYIQLSTF